MSSGLSRSEIEHIVNREVAFSLGSKVDDALARTIASAVARGVARAIEENNKKLDRNILR